MSIIVPTTCIKNPGLLLTSQNQSFYQTPSLQSLLEDFKVKSQMDSDSSDDLSPQSSITSKNFRQGFSISSEMKTIAKNSFFEPGRIKKSSDDTSCLIQLAQKVLLKYNIKLTMGFSCKQSKIFLAVLKTLVPEISFFSTQFIQSLNIKEFCFSEEDSSSSSRTLSFDLKALDSFSKAHKKLYQIIFNGLITTCPKLLQQWESIEQNQQALRDNGSSLLKSLEETFIALMSCHKKESNSEKAQELRKLLSELFPEMSQEWFQLREIEKKKNAKVTFLFDM